MKLFVVGAFLLLLSAASLADRLPGAAPPETSGASGSAQAPPGGGVSQESSEPKPAGPSCRRAAFGTCKGCSITCNKGERAVCSDVLYSWDSNKCIRDAACTCRPPRR